MPAADAVAPLAAAARPLRQAHWPQPEDLDLAERILAPGRSSCPSVTEPLA